MQEPKLFPKMGFRTERHYGEHYIVNFGRASAGVTWIGDTWRIAVWGVWPHYPSRHVPDELSVLAILYDIKSIYGDKNDNLPTIRP